MTHQQIEEHGIVDAYLRRQLTDDDRQAFEEHYFACDICFDEVRTAQRMAAGVRHAVAVGLLPQPVDGQVQWWRLSFAVSAAAAAMFLAISLWAMLVELPRLRQDAVAARVREGESTQRAQQLRKKLDEQQIAMAHPPTPEGGNLPLVMLEATRADAVNVLTVPANAQQVAFWMESGPSAYQTFRLEITGARSPIILPDLKKNSYGAVAAVAPASALQSGEYRARLYGTSGPAVVLVAEYRLEIRR